MTGIFQQKNPGNLFVLFFAGILLRLPLFFSSGDMVVTPQDSLLYSKLGDVLKQMALVFPPVNALLVYLIIFFQAYLLQSFINNSRLMPKANFLAAMAYILITSLSRDFNVLSPALLVSAIGMAVFRLLFSIHNQNVSRGNIFNAGILLGVGILIFLPSLLLVLWACIILAVMRPFRLREWLLLLAGILTPYYFLAVGLYLSGNWNADFFYHSPHFGLPQQQYTIWHTISLFLLLMPLLAGIYYIQTVSGRMLIHIRKAWNLFMIYTAICFAITFINAGTNLENWVMVLLPIAAIHSYGYFHAEWKPYPRIMFWLSVAFILSAQLFNGMW